MFLDNIINNKKKCKKCEKEKTVEEFPISNSKKGKLIKSFCKICFNELERKRYYQKNKDKIEAKKEEALSKEEYNKQYYEKNKDKILKQVKFYFDTNKNKILGRQKEYYKKNRENILEKRKEKQKDINEYVKNKRKQDINVRIAHNLRTRISSTIKKNVKWKKSKEILGCSIEAFRDYLETKFRDGMTWENYGSYWHIDHIKPCSAFNLALKEEQEKCFHYINLQPLTVEENHSKSDKF